MNPRDDISRAIGLLDALIDWPHDYSSDGRTAALKEARELLERARAELNAVFRRGGTAPPERQGVDPSPATHSCTATKTEY